MERGNAISVEDRYSDCCSRNAEAISQDTDIGSLQCSPGRVCGFADAGACYVEAIRHGSDSGSVQCGRGSGCGFSDAGARAADSKQRSASIKRLGLAVTLCFFFMSLEVAGGVKANSLAILTDAAHLLSDVASFAISLFAIWASSWEATPRQTYGFYRLEILGALVSMQMIRLVTGILVYKAIHRMLHGNGYVDGRLTFIVVTVGFVVNLLIAFVLGQEHSHGCDHADHEDVQQDDQHDPLLTHSSSVHEHHKWRGIQRKSSHKSTFRLDEDVDLESGSKRTATGNNINVQAAYINVQGVYLHLHGDLIQRIGIIFGGALIWVEPEWKRVDLLCTLFFSVLAFVTTIKMSRGLLEILMESTPREIDASKLEEGLLAIPGVVAVHELHIWAITVGKILLACHVRIQFDADGDEILQKVIVYCENDYKIRHVTIQVERDQS
eukprot:TRINITY_DN8408_c0_g1_i2.p1 TRINITY_DN8408_c0_g1~~TRINITY_DN8408_c0_g1_i2.p1  ORF type:complete len:439 (-),score=79.61 TRINITY_DN8408_c0_g1_i2:122-1438(-)